MNGDFSGSDRVRARINELSRVVSVPSFDMSVGCVEGMHFLHNEFYTFIEEKNKHTWLYEGSSVFYVIM